MIKIGCDDFDITKFLQAFDCKNPFFCRVISLYKAYSTKSDFADFWCQFDSNGDAVSAISRLDGQVTLHITNRSDIDEIADFISFLHPYSVLCDSSADLKLQGYSKASGKVLKFCGNCSDFTKKAEASVTKNPNIKDVFNLLKATEFDNFEDTDFESFYLDLSHKIRHNCARAYGVYSGTKLISCAVSAFETKSCAVISAVSTDKCYRRQGIGRTLLENMIFDLKSENKEIFVYREIDKNIDFYNKLNFAEAFGWSEYKRIKE